MPRSTRVTQADVARRAGVSRTVASFVLNGRTDQRIAASTAERVLAAADELGYRPNRIAGILRTGSSQTIALVSDYIATTAAANAMIRGALEGAREQGLVLFTAETLGDSALEASLIDDLRDRRVDGFIYASMFTQEVSVPEALLHERTVLLNCVDTAHPLPSITPDDEAAGARAAHLVLTASQQGDVAFLGSLPQGSTAGDAYPGARPLALPRRLSGLRAGLSARGIALSAPDLPRAAWDAPTGFAAALALLRSSTPPAAIVCANDALAMGVYQAAAETGTRIPDDLEVVSFDGSELAKWLRPALVTLALPHAAMGRNAVELLADASPLPGERALDMPVVRGGSLRC